MREFRNIILTFLVLSLFLFTIPSQASDSYWLSKIESTLLSKTGKLDVFIQVSNKTVVDFTGPVTYRNDIVARMFESALDKNIFAIMGKCKQAIPNLKKGWTFNTVLNGFSCTIDRESLEKIARVDGVLRVMDATFRYQMTINKHLPLIGVTKLRSIGTLDGKKITGGGMRVGVIDTGINYKHQALGDGWGRRVKMGYDFADNDSDPMDQNGHGSHCSGIIGTNGKLYDIPVTGVAPEVNYGAYKVFTVDEGGARPANVAAALEMAAKDRCVSVNMSLGRPLNFGGEDELESAAIKNATKAGSLVVVAAGNDGFRSDKLPLPIGVPGTTDEALCVGATDEQGRGLLELPLANGKTKKIVAINSWWGVSGVEDGEYEVVDGGKDTDRTKIPDCTGKLCLVEFSSASRSWHRTEAYDVIREQKRINSKGFLFWVKDQDGIPFTLSYFEDQKDVWFRKVPVYTINAKDAVMIKDAIKQGTKLKAKRLSFPGDFSATGPYLGPRGLIFKPEITAPGVEILSTVVDENNMRDSWATYSGTSMAAPFVTGCAALVRQYHPTWPPLKVKAALMNTAKFSINPFNEEPYPLDVQGSGLVDVHAACITSVTAQPPAFTFHGGNFKNGMRIGLHNDSPTKATVKVKVDIQYIGAHDGLTVTPVLTSEVVSPSLGTAPEDPTTFIDVKIDVDKDKILKERLLFGAIVVTVDDSLTIHIPFMSIFSNSYTVYNTKKFIDSVIVQNKSINIENAEKPGKVKFHLGVGSKSFFWGDQYDNFAQMVRISVLDDSETLNRWRDIYEACYLPPGDYEFDWDGNDLNGESFLPNGDNPVGAFIYYDVIVGSGMNMIVESSPPKEAQETINVFGSINLPLPKLRLEAVPTLGALGNNITIKIRFERASSIRVVRLFLLYDQSRVAYTGKFRRGDMALDETSSAVTIEDGGDGRMMIEILPIYQGLYIDGSGELIEIDFKCIRTGGVEFDTSFVEVLDKNINKIRYVPAISIEVNIAERYMLMGDFNFDWKVDVEDLAIIAKAIGSKEGDPEFVRACDINHNKLIDYEDFVYFSNHFGERVEKPSP